MRRTNQKAAGKGQVDPSTLISSQVENASAQQDQMEPPRESWIRDQTVAEQMNSLVPPLQEGYSFVVLAFLSMDQSLATPLLNLLFVRYSYFSPYSNVDEQVKNTLCSFLETWMDKNPEDFCDPSDLLLLEHLKAYFSVYMPNSDLSVRVTRLLTQLQ